ncbi:MAG: ABC transporter ATP-binding protein [Flavobacteriales bacterium]|nr:ABC transporter ATP-binding protein [Flavobacteriales bacterium]
MNNDLLHTEGLAVGHAGKPVLSGVDLRLGHGKLAALIGVNGSGKSTLLRTIAGIHPPIDGRLHVKGKDIQAMGARERARAVSLVFTGRTHLGLLDVRSVVALGRQPWTGHFGRLSAVDLDHVEEALRTTGLHGLADRDIATLSDGEHQRVMIARALAQDTRLMLLDEPTAFLDLVNRVRVMRLLRELAHAGDRSVLISTHDLRTALDMADVLLLAHQGVAWSGSPAEALEQGVLARAFQDEGMCFDPRTATLR